MVICAYVNSSRTTLICRWKAWIRPAAPTRGTDCIDTSPLTGAVPELQEDTDPGVTAVLCGQGRQAVPQVGCSKVVPDRRQQDESTVGGVCTDRLARGTQRKGHLSAFMRQGGTFFFHEHNELSHFNNTTPFFFLLCFRPTIGHGKTLHPPSSYFYIFLSNLE